MKNFNNYVGDELANKVHALTKALEQAEDIISKLETENSHLNNVLHTMMGSDKDSYILDSEVLYV